MRDSLFKRYITAFGMTLLTCTFLLGLALLYFSAYSFTQRQQQQLYQAAGTAMLAVTENTEFTGTGDAPIRFKSLAARKAVLGEFENIFKTTTITVFLSDLVGNVELCSDGTDCIHTNTKVPDSILNEMRKNGEVYRTEYLQGIFGSGNFNYGRAIYDDQRQVAGYLFVLSPIRPLYTNLSEMFLTFLVSTATMIIAATVIIYFATRSLVKPLHEIATAANKFGGGDFGARVTVNGEDEIARLASSFNRMADSLAEFENMRRGFVANVSHELRTPMTTIAGYIDGILDNTIPTERENHYLSIVSEEVKRLSRLTSSLLDITRMEEGAVSANIVSINVWEVILSVMGSCERRISGKNIQVPDINDEPRYAYCDRDMLYQVVYNLIDNAIKFTPEQGILSVVSEQHNGTVSITVRNTGKGIAPQELSYVFERFYKVDKSRGLDRTGTGLGLYIAKTLVQKMNGEISVSSLYGEYAEFTVRLQAGPPPERDRTAGKGKSAHTSSWFRKKQTTGEIKTESRTETPAESDSEPKREQSSAQKPGLHIWTRTEAKTE